ncbi:hypothetical protein [Sphingobacterium tabacisoli]|uniref:Uncharacterized protein n=1 Tax=Sphingobacterium tabacisoli TaxID=2044855 RepID=A0ABW5L5V6_9SPHI|nr:hypothetical protein [Sphingobacterium tabacisoli]
MEIKNTVSQIYFRINVLSILLCIILSCRTAKEKSELLRMNTKAQSVSRTNTSWMQLNRQDSTYRYWHYTGDSIFFFHPDRGLWSRSGQFTYIEQKSSDAKDEKMVFQQDSLRTVKAESQLDTYYRSESHFLKQWPWILLLGVLVATCWMVIKVKKAGRI